MVEVFTKENKELMVAEDTDFWGNPTDIISMLIGDFYTEKTQLEEPTSDSKTLSIISEFSEAEAESDKEFMEIATQLSKWFGNLKEKQLSKKQHPLS